MRQTAGTTLSSDAQSLRSTFDAEWPLDRIWTAEWRDIEYLQLLPGSPIRQDIWELPREWAGSGPAQSPGARRIDFLKALPPEWNRFDPRSEMVLRRLKRVATLLFVRTLRLNEQVRNPPQPSTWVAMLKRTCRVARDALRFDQSRTKQSSCPDAHPIFANLTPSQLDVLRTHHRGFFEAETPRLNALFRHGHFDDWPAGDVSPAERQQNKRKWQPFPDDFTALVGHAAVWTVEVLGPDLLECWEGLCRVTDETRGMHFRNSQPLRRDYVRSWRGRTVNEALQFPYCYGVIRGDGKTVGRRLLSSWSDVRPSEVHGLVRLLQEAHAAVVSLATGPRNGELSSLPRDCLREVMGSNLLRGYTFKLAEESEARDWPLPAVAVFAIRQQQRLAEVLDPGGDKLFVSFSGPTTGCRKRERLQIPADRFTDGVHTLDGKTLTSQCSGSVHSHRYRKTVARLAALSLVGANQILFDILGHRDPEMTLNYILSDPELQDQMRKIAQEAAIVMAKQAVANPDLNGGPAATGVRELAGRFLARSAKEELDESSLRTVAEILSQNGRVMLVKKNVLCTKALNQAGPCNKRIGNPDVGNCHVDCLHRLEFAAAKQDHRVALDQALAEIASAEGLMRVWWQGQIVSHLIPFPDLGAEMLQDTRVRAALKGVKLDAFAHLKQAQRATALELLEKIA